MKHIKDAKELLCKKLLHVARLKKTPAWTMKDLNLSIKETKKAEI